MAIYEKLFALQSFQRQYEALLILSVCDTIPDLQLKYSREFLLSSIDWNNLLSIASILAYSDLSVHLEVALRIAQVCIQEQNTYDNQKSAAAIILELLTNKPAIKLALERNYLPEDYQANIPSTMYLDIINSNISNSIIINNEIVNLNKFQKNVQEAYENNHFISISAPTSSGKSFILYQIVLEEIFKSRDSIKTIIYIVPTRALISQVEEDLREQLFKKGLLDVIVSSIPQITETTRSHIFVFTQERLHRLLTEYPALNIDILIVDEAQKIDDSNRGILLQHKIEDVITLNPNIKIYFSSPFTSNPGLLLDLVNKNKTNTIVDTPFISVNQNLIYLSQVPRCVDEYNVSLCLIDKRIDLGIIKTSYRSGDSDFKKITLIALAMAGKKDGNLIYANGSAEAEKCSFLLFNFLSEQQILDEKSMFGYREEISEESLKELKELSKLVKKTIHPKYILAKVLLKGIAFHYGNMPLLIRQEIERLFKKGAIKYLICTSTLVEGVNLPTKSIFIRHPQRGKNTPLNQSDFRNLAGRAGRWGKEFSGNIICINPDDWAIPPNPNKAKQEIKIALDEIKFNKSDALINYINKGTPRKESDLNNDLEFAFCYYYIRYLEGKLNKNDAFENRLINIFETLKSTINIPLNIIKRNPGISPIAQQNLYDYIKTKKNVVDTLLPVYPEDEDAYKEYIKLVARIGKTLAYYPSKLNPSYAILLINWMSGKPLSVIILASYKNYIKNPDNKKKLSNVIREVMDKVENFVRFRFAKDSSCYMDILRYYLIENNRQDLIDKIPNFNLWLEFGVNQKTHLSMLALGLSRHTVIELSEFIMNTELTIAESLKWLKENKETLSTLNLSPIIIAEIERIIK